MIRQPPLRLSAIVVAVALAAPVLATSTTATSTPKSSGVGFWAGEEFKGGGFDYQKPLTYWNERDTSAYTKKLWSVLAAERIPLGMHLRYKRDFGPVPAGMPKRSDGLRLVQEANRRGVPVLAWLVLPFTDGYWSTEKNAAQTAAAINDFRAWRVKHHLSFREIVLDPEMPIQTLGRFISIFGGHPEALAQIYSENIDPKGQCQAMRAYRDLISAAHRNGERLTAAPVPMAMDDLVDGNLALQDALDIVATPPFGWDALYYQAYRSPAVAATGIDPGSAWVASYLDDAKRRSGKAGQVSLGEGGRAPYDSLDTLVRDIRMLAGLGAAFIPIYSLELTLKTFSPSQLRTIVRAFDRPLEGADLERATAPTPQSIGTRQFLQSLDRGAVAATPVVTAGSSSGPQLPNAFPDGCGDLRASSRAGR